MLSNNTKKKKFGNNFFVVTAGKKLPANYSINYFEKFQSTL